MELRIGNGELRIKSVIERGDKDRKGIATLPTVARNDTIYQRLRMMVLGGVNA